MEKKVRVSLNEHPESRDIPQFVHVANQYDSSLYMVSREGFRVNIKSIMGMMNFQASNGQEVIIQAEGQDQEEAMEAMVRCLTGKG
ncbi:MAG: HPr family phosphocarrier protein [Lachnospiraceae bacterium]|nr:HPr family phosphocarrier protein [Lachnospiraceae bacterium]